MRGCASLRPISMFGFLKRFGRKRRPPTPPALVTPVPAAPGSETIMPAAAAQPAAESLIRAAAPPVLAAPAPVPVHFSGATVDLPLRALWKKLSPALVQSATRHPASDALLKLPMELIRPMLAKGAVKIVYPQFREFAPSGLFPSGVGKENLVVEIPLADVLARLSPDHLARQPQRKLEIPDEIGAVFGPGAGKAAGLRVADGTSKPMVSAAPTLVAEVVPKVEAPAPAPKLTPVFAPILPAPPAPQTPPPVSVAPPEWEPIRAPKLDPALASLKPKPAEGTFHLELMEVAGHWASAGKTKLEALTSHAVEIPTTTLESALKTGKLVFPWRELRPWMRLTEGASMPTIEDDFAIELPLAVVAPKFMAQRQPSQPRKRVTVSDEIPDLFAQKTVAAPSAPATATAPAGPAAATPMATSLAGARPALEFGEIFGQPERKNWTFADVTQKTATLRGVAGALIATSDGLLVAGTWPEGVQTEAVAAFIPQMYGRMIQCTKELNLGEPGNFTLLIENVPLQVFNTSGNYLAVLGRAGENLPKPQLNALAMRLAMTQPVK
jgi:predicted regulator of Ras-like GTPase activity (Roadblock/LC7/MglB family)